MLCALVLGELTVYLVNRLNRKWSSKVRKALVASYGIFPPTYTKKNRTRGKEKCTRDTGNPIAVRQWQDDCADWVVKDVDVDREEQHPG